MERVLSWCRNMTPRRTWSSILLVVEIMPCTNVTQTLLGYFKKEIDSDNV